jgi:glycosyltransferase 2 family protein
VSSPAETETNDPRRRKGRAWVKVAIKSTLGLIVLFAVARHARKTLVDIDARGESVRIEPGSFAVAVGLYIAGLVPLGVFYGRVLAASQTPISNYAAVRAYLISHLGKYVPGKALVVVMRAGLSVPYGARPATAAFATFYETLVMMAAGGLFAAVAFGWDTVLPIVLPLGIGAVRIPLALLGLGMGIAFLVVVEPRVFPRLASLGRLPFRGVGADALPRVTWRLLGAGLLWSTLGWTLLGLSQVAVLGMLGPSRMLQTNWPAVVASVALATVAGFVVPLAPGGLGVREWVLWTSLSASIDRDRAVVAALLLRLAWMVGELIAATIVGVLRPTPVVAGTAAP